MNSIQAPDDFDPINHAYQVGCNDALHHLVLSAVGTRVWGVSMLDAVIGVASRDVLGYVDGSVIGSLRVNYAISDHAMPPRPSLFLSPLPAER